MRFRWDSGVARDIVTELDRMEQELDDCVMEVDRGAGILAQMQGGDLSEAIGKYISAIDKLKKGLKRLSETCGSTSRGVLQADELFDGFEARLRGRVESMGTAGAAPGGGDAGAWSGAAPIGETVTTDRTDPIIHMIIPVRQPPWPILEGIGQTVVIDQVAANTDVVMPQWLAGIVHSPEENR